MHALPRIKLVRARIPERSVLLTVIQVRSPQRTARCELRVRKAALLCNPLHLASKVVGQRGTSGLPYDGLPERELLFHAPTAPSGKDQNHTGPCFFETMPSRAFAFFAVLSLMPASRIREIISCCGFVPSASKDARASFAA